jgi:hypothetical protein
MEQVRENFFRRLESAGKRFKVDHTTLRRALKARSSCTLAKNANPDALMNKPQRIEATEVYFIKLGRGGKWEEECLRDGILRFGYDEASHEDCEAGNWDAVYQYYLKYRRNNKGTARSDTTQIKIFYTAPSSAIKKLRAGSSPPSWT